MVAVVEPRAAFLVGWGCEGDVEVVVAASFPALRFCLASARNWLFEMVALRSSSMSHFLALRVVRDGMRSSALGDEEMERERNEQGEERRTRDQ